VIVAAGVEKQDKMKNLFNDIKKGAIFSPDKKNRYTLYRIWDEEKPLVMFIGLNPSTANASDDDPTIRRVQSMAKSWGYGGFYMMNLFCQVTPYPSELRLDDNKYSGNLSWLLLVRKVCKDVVFAWGNFNVLGMDKKIMKYFPDAFALHINKNGSPKHPLYVKANTPLIKFIQP
jgi:hypothetical protein